MKIEYVDKIELYRMGYFCDSFDTIEEVEKAVEKLIRENGDDECPSAWKYNQQKYSIIKSKHLVFKD